MRRRRQRWAEPQDDGLVPRAGQDRHTRQKIVRLVTPVEAQAIAQSRMEGFDELPREKRDEINYAPNGSIHVWRFKFARSKKESAARGLLGQLGL